MHILAKKANNEIKRSLQKTFNQILKQQPPRHLWRYSARGNKAEVTILLTDLAKLIPVMFGYNVDDLMSNECLLAHIPN